MSIIKPRISGLIIFPLVIIFAGQLVLLSFGQPVIDKSPKPVASQSLLTDNLLLKVQKQSGDPNPKAKNKRTTIPVEVAQLLDKTAGIPAEYRSDALLLIIQVPAFRDVETKVSLIEEAFQLAAKSQVPFKKVLLPGSHVDIRDGYLAYAYDLNLDALSLQCRAVRAMIPLNPLKAREIFRTVEIPKVPEQRCEDALLPDVSDFYSTLREVAQRTFGVHPKSETTS